MLYIYGNFCARVVKGWMQMEPLLGWLSEVDQLGLPKVISYQIILMHIFGIFALGLIKGLF